jgi:hypothetical protein
VAATRARRAAAGVLVALGVLAAVTGAVLLLVRDGEEGERLPLQLQTSETAAPDHARPIVELSDVRGYDDGRSYVARTPEDPYGVNKYARAAADEIEWGAGTEVWYGAAFYLPDGFYAAQQGEVDLLRWDNFELDRESTDRGGVVVYGGNETGNAYLIRARLGGEQDELVGPFRLEEGKWHWIEVQQRFGADGDGDLSAVWVDGNEVGRSTRPNWYGRPITAIRFGLVATGGARQKNPLALWFDRPTISDSRVGPVD